ncbi:MAG: hypothetical protein ACTTKY_05490 [Catonella sp.]
MDKKTYTCICTAILEGALVLVNNDKVNYIGVALCGRNNNWRDSDKQRNKEKMKR